jgi:hypothetical protein
VGAHCAIIPNAINIGVDLGAIAAALKLLIVGPLLLYVAAFAIVTVPIATFLRASSPGFRKTVS